ncbi:MAG TPA: hypothetical protein VF659_23150 [Pyrinomonadaceae bacterium]|jgi:hypothetical protein
MSDYLWDKTGGPDEEVERLEALLGGLGHRPRPLVLPAQAAPDVRRRPRLSGWAGLAAAAALLLASLLGAVAFLRSRPAMEEKRAAAAATGAPRPRDEGQARRETAPRVAEPTPGGVLKDERAAEDLRRGPRGVGGGKAEQVASLPRRQQRRPAAAARVGARAGASPAVEAMSASGYGASSLFESTRLMAKEQLVYALRLTGAKLRDVRQKTQGRGGPVR